jgi:hypothetical protein
MTRGKAVCKALKSVRKRIAEANEIDYQPRECHHEGECAGTCPACEAEVRYLERQLSLRRLAGKAVVIAGLSIGLTTVTGCRTKRPTVLEGIIPAPNTNIGNSSCDSTAVSPTDSIDIDKYRLEGDVIYVPTETPEKKDTPAKKTTKKKGK